VAFLDELGKEPRRFVRTLLDENMGEEHRNVAAAPSSFMC
jgi:hypothetical protein